LVSKLAQKFNCYYITVAYINSLTNQYMPNQNYQKNQVNSHYLSLNVIVLLTYNGTRNIAIANGQLSLSAVHIKYVGHRNDLQRSPKFQGHLNVVLQQITRFPITLP